MIEPVSAVAAWKTIASLYDKFDNWAVRRKRSKEAARLLAEATAIMDKINKGLLSGKSSDDPSLAPLIKQFKELVAKDIKPDGVSRTEEWISKGYSNSHGGGTGGARKPVAKYALPRSALKSVATMARPTSAVEKVAAKSIANNVSVKPVAKKTTAVSVAKKAAGKPVAKTVASKSVASKAKPKSVTAKASSRSAVTTTAGKTTKKTGTRK